MTNKDEKIQSNPENEPEQELNKEENAELVQLKKDLESAKAQAGENYDLYLRAVADAENGRKRLLKDVENSKKFALEGFCKDMLTVLDGFDKALQTDSQTEVNNAFFDGVGIVRKQLFEILERNGLQEIQALGKKFDAHLHQAIKRTESADVKEETVDCVYAKGYKMFDKLLRPSIVSVLVPGTNP